MTVEIVSDRIDDEGHHRVARTQQQAHRDISYILLRVPLFIRTRRGKLIEYAIQKSKLQWLTLASKAWDKPRQEVKESKAQVGNAEIPCRTRQVSHEFSSLILLTIKGGAVSLKQHANRDRRKPK